MFESNEENIESKRGKLKILSLGPYEFETYIAELFTKLGYTVKQTPPSNDGGKDIVLTYGRKKYYVECKHYSTGNFIGREILQKAVGAAVIDGDVDACIIITTSHFNENTLIEAQKSSVVPIYLLDFEDIIQLKALSKTEDIFMSDKNTSCNYPNSYNPPTAKFYGLEGKLSEDGTNHLKKHSAPKHDTSNKKTISL